MIKKKFSMSVEMVGSDDVRYTYGVHRKWNNNAKKALVIGLYPTIRADRAGKMDLSTMHLLNHVSDFGWGELSIVNLYSEVFEEKPLVSRLSEDSSNISYIEELLESDDINNYDIIIAWGNSLYTHKGTIERKIDLLSMMKDKGLSKNVKCIVTDSLATVTEYGIHPLYLGLRHAKELWKLIDYPLEECLKKLTGSDISKKDTANKDTIKLDSKENIENKEKKGEKKNVPKNKKQA